jgi:GAF domain-containing protein
MSKNRKRCQGNGIKSVLTFQAGLVFPSKNWRPPDNRRLRLSVSADKVVTKAYTYASGLVISANMVFDRILGQENIVSEAPAGLEVAQRLNSFLNIPLMINGRIVGMINLSTHRERSFSPDDIRLVYAMVSQVSSTRQRLSGIKAGQRNSMLKLAQAMSEGLVLVDENLKVVLANESAQKILGEKDPTGECIRMVLGLDLAELKAQMEEGQSDLVRRKMEIRSQNYELAASVLKGETEDFLGLVISLGKSPNEQQH